MKIKFNNGESFDILGFQRNWFPDVSDYNFQLVNRNDSDAIMKALNTPGNLDVVILERAAEDIVLRDLELSGVNESIEEHETRFFVRLQDKEVPRTSPENLL